MKSDCFPSDVLKWIKLNVAKPRLMLKLMQVCKFFQHKKFPYFVATDIDGYGDRLFYRHLGGDDVLRGIEEIPDYNLWIVNSIYVDVSSDMKLISELIRKIAVCDAQDLHVTNQIIPFDEFKVLAHSAKKLHLNDTFIYDHKVEPIPLELILDSLPNVEDIYFSIDVPVFTSKVAASQTILSKLRHFEIEDIPETLTASDIEALFEFMKANKNVSFVLSFASFPCPHLHSPQLRTYVEEIIAAGDLEYPPPMIYYFDQTPESVIALKDLQKAYEFHRLFD